MRRFLICAAISPGCSPRMKTTTPGSIGGMKVAIAWPNMWLSGRRFRKRTGQNGRLHLRCFRTSRSTGTMFARTFRWVMTTPLGSAVAPDVKMISATSSRRQRNVWHPGADVRRRPPSRARAASRRGCPTHGRAVIGGTSWPISTSFAATMRLTRAGSPATRDSRSARRRCRGAGSPRRRRSTPDGSRSRRQPCRLSGAPARAGWRRSRARRARLRSYV